MEARLETLIESAYGKIVHKKGKLSLRPCARTSDDNNGQDPSTYQLYQDEEPMLMWISILTSIFDDSTDNFEHPTPWRNTPANAEPHVTPGVRSITVQIEIAEKDNVFLTVLIPSHKHIVRGNVIRITPFLENVDNKGQNICVRVTSQADRPETRSKFDMYLNWTFKGVLACVIKEKCHKSYGSSHEGRVYIEDIDQPFRLTVFPDKSEAHD